MAAVPKLMALDASEPNLALWLRLETTDPAYVKAITGKQYKGSSPNPTYIAKKLTAAFGPAGHGWRVEVLEEKILQGKPHGPGEYDLIHQVRIRMHTCIDGAWGWFDQIGQTTMVYKKRDGAWTDDEDAPKKSLTDAMTKAASWLGVSGDIFLGRWDDSKYQSDLAVEAKAAGAVAEASSAHAQALQAKKMADEAIEVLDRCNDLVSYMANRGTQRALYPMIVKLSPSEGNRLATAITAMDEKFGYKPPPARPVPAAAA